MPELDAATLFTFQVEGLSTPLSVTRFEAVEAVSELFEIDLALTSDDKDIPLSSVVGKSVRLTLESYGSEPRYLHGFVCRFRHAEDGKKLSGYHATVVPRLWRLQHRRDSRIFQGMTVPEILKVVLGDQGISFRLALTGAYAAREYCVQYRESDLTFVSRLMEEEGIYYFFEHSDADHVMVLADSPDAPAPIVAPDTLPYRGALGAMAHGEGVSRFWSTEEVRPGKVSLTDYNFKKPSLSLMASSQTSLDTDLEIYDYPGEYELPGDGSTYARVRLEEWQTRRLIADGATGCVRMTPGFTFTLSDHPRDAENGSYLITGVRHRGMQAQMGELEAAGSVSYENTFQCIPAGVPMRPVRKTPRPKIEGVQPAIVTGPSGDEIHTDEHGRVKVQFFWDRLGKKDDKSSCWIRVSQPWAGAGFGGIMIPRIGQEVIVDFVEGDPDRPIITGRVYHGANVPPYTLPGDKTRSTLKSNSSPGGGGSNELRFEDKAGQEEVYLHGQKDWTIRIENDKNQEIGNDETKQVGHDETESVGNDQTLSVGHDRSKEVAHDQSETVGNDKTIKVGHDHEESIGHDEAKTIGGDASRSVAGKQDVDVGGDHTRSVGANDSVTVSGERTVEVGGGQSESIGKDATVTVGGNLSTSVAKDHSLTVSGGSTTNVTKDQQETIEGNDTITVGKKFALQVGEGTVTVDKSGKITISGKDITVEGGGKINVKAGSKVIVKSDGPVNIEASGAVKVKGSNIGLN